MWLAVRAGPALNVVNRELESASKWQWTKRQ
jgi:hypothetical protein